MDTKTQQIIQHGFDTLLEVHKEDLRMQKKINDKIEEINKQLEDITHSLETIDIKTIR